MTRTTSPRTIGAVTFYLLCIGTALLPQCPARGQARQVSEEAKIYLASKPAVVTVECDFGSGSGFIVDRRGLILTNQHVTNGTHWAAIRFDRGLRFNAVVVAEDKVADVAVLRFNPEAHPDFKVLTLADTSKPPIAVEGEKVVAIGSPLRQEKVMTLGIISKVEPGVLISDVNINHGNSGGPLLNMAGEVIGINTFLNAGEPNGPGLAGVVSIEKVRPVLDHAAQSIDGTQLPDAAPLPDISTVAIPPEMLTAAADDKKDQRPFTLKGPHNFVTHITTPFIVAGVEAKQQRDLTKDQRRRLSGKHAEGTDNLERPRRFWERYAVEDYDPVVTVEVLPALKETAGSMWGGLFAGALGVHHTAQLEFRADFYDMQLYRGDTLVPPVRRQRDGVQVLYADWNVIVKDSAYGGIYFYDPSAFNPEEPVTLRIRRAESLDKWETLKLDKAVQRQIWDQFAAYREIPRSQ